MKLRPYQKEAIEAIVTARRNGIRRMVVCLPTGAGKTVIFSRLAALAHRPVLVLAHREELLEQALDKIQRVAPEDVLIDIEQGERRASDQARVVVASLRSLHDERLDALLEGRDFGLIVYDECHHAVAEDNMRILTRLGCFDDDWEGTLLGFTATTQRADGVGLEKAFEEIVFYRGLIDLIREGYLCNLRGFRVSTAADLRRLTGGGLDFSVEELAEAVDIEERNALVARSIQELARDRRTLAFCVTVRHARNLARALNIIGVPAGFVHGEMKSEQRAFVLESFRNHDIHVLANVGVLTEGFDDPGVSCIAMARPTRSEGLYVQCVGRGTRLHPGKEDCLILDFCDLSTLPLVTLPSLFGLPREMDLEGADVEEAERALKQLTLDFPTFEVEPGEITLGEIQRRAASFNPLTLDIHPEIMAISGNAWESLGSAGLALHVLGPKGLQEITVINTRRRGRSRYQVAFDDEEKATFARIEEAVEAVDYELAALGEGVARSARPEAGWRQDPPTDSEYAALRELKPPRRAQTRGEALRYLVHARHARRQRWGR